MKKIKNPLTIIGLFAGIAEIAGTTVLPLVSENVQSIFIWYVMGFPVLLVVLFFITLNFNPKVLYSPSDFADEKNFMTLLTQITKAVDNVITVSPDIEKKLKPVEIAIETAAMQTNNDKNCVRVSIDPKHLSGADISTNILFDPEKAELQPKAYVLFSEKRINLDKEETSIGRQSDIIVDDLTVSRKHCIISKLSDGSFSIRDCSASNGTLVNNVRIGSQSAQLHNGDSIQIGRVSFSFYVEQ